MNTNSEIRKAMTRRRHRQQKIRQSMLNRSAAEIETPKDTDIQAKARTEIARERQQAEHIKESMLARSVAEVGIPIDNDEV